MHYAPKLLLLAVSIGLTAPAAGATPISVVDEATGQPCSNVALSDHAVVGGCTVHAIGVGVELEGEIFGFHIHEDTCDNEYVMHMNGSGSGYISGLSITNCEGFRVPCDAESGETHAERPSNTWPFVATETAPDVVAVTISACLITGIGECEGNFVVQTAELGDDDDETHTATANGVRIGSSPCEIDGTWTMEGTEKVHVNHIH